MNAPFEARLIPQLFQMDRQAAIGVLRTSIFPNAKVESVEMVLAYCEAAGLDPMQKPVHIVPMSVRTGQKDSWGDDIYEERDQVLPGIGLYRTQAARTGKYAGQQPPEWGPNHPLTYKKKFTTWEDKPGGGRKKKTEWRDHEIMFPEWCRVTVLKIVDGQVRQFVSEEYWLENYATASANTNAPNRMWEKRTRGQLKKCAEAQALRMAFPEAVDAGPTAEEIEGKRFDPTDPDDDTGADGNASGIRMPESKSAAAKAEATDATVISETNTAAAAPPPAPAAPTPAPAPVQNATGKKIGPSGAVKYLESKVVAAGKDLAQVLARFGVTATEDLTEEQFATLRSELLQAA